MFWVYFSRAKRAKNIPDYFARIGAKEMVGVYFHPRERGRGLVVGKVRRTQVRRTLDLWC